MSTGTKIVSHSALVRASHTKFWDPTAFDFAAMTADWPSLTGVEQGFLSRLLCAFLAGEHVVAVELDCLIPALRWLGFHDVIPYIYVQTVEEQRHEIFFREALAAVGVEPETVNLREALRNGAPDLPAVLSERLSAARDQPDDLQKIVEAVAVYFLVTEGVAAMTLTCVLERVAKHRPAFQMLAEAAAYLRADEARHFAGGLSVARRIIGKHPETKAAFIDELKKLRRMVKLVLAFPFLHHLDATIFGVSLKEVYELSEQHYKSRADALASAA